MGITLRLKKISVSTLEVLRQNPEQVDFFYEAKWLKESAYWQTITYKCDLVVQQQAEEKFSSFCYRKQFVGEWEIPELDLHKYFPELTYLLAGYIPYFSERLLALPELQSRRNLMKKNNFMKFFWVQNKLHLNLIKYRTLLKNLLKIDNSSFLLNKMNLSRNEIKKLYAQGEWEKQWYVVTEIFDSKDVTILVSNATDASVDFKVEADAEIKDIEIGKIDLSNAYH